MTTDTEPSRLSLFRRRQHRPEAQPHGWQRASDRTVTSTSRSGSAADRRRATPAGTTLLLTLIVGVLTAIGIARVHATTRVLELGDLGAEQANLLDERRRLAAERAYLRHPDHIDEVARNRLQMIPMSPDLVQKIRLQAPVGVDHEEGLDAASDPEAVEPIVPAAIGGPVHE